MTRSLLAAQLLLADDAPKRRALLRRFGVLADVRLAYALKDETLEAWSSAPQSVINGAAGLCLLARITRDKEIAALSVWCRGVAALVKGRMERAVALLDRASRMFHSLGKPQQAAETQVSKLIALAMLSRYDEAIECGLSAREILIAADDLLAAGKIEHNIGNIYFRRDRYREAEHFQSHARKRFKQLGDEKQLATIDNCLANTYAALNDFRAAEELYSEALALVTARGQAVTQAEIESNIGNLALFQGRYDRALDFLERSRRRYAGLGMPQHSATTEQEIADAYLDLNLVPEAHAIYERVEQAFERLGMHTERARTLAQMGRASLLLGLMVKAHAMLSEARRLYDAEENAVGGAMVLLIEAQLHLSEDDNRTAAILATKAVTVFDAAGIWRRLLMARWIVGEAKRKQQFTGESRLMLEANLSDARHHAQPQIAQLCLTSLGLLAAATGAISHAENRFSEAVKIIEELRSPLPAEEFRTAYFTDKLVPYYELARICLDAENRERADEAFVFVERARSRALIETPGGIPCMHAPEDDFEIQLCARLEELREELNWYYSRINRAPHERVIDTATAVTPPFQDVVASLHDAVRERETETLEIMRRLQHRRQSLSEASETLNLEQLKHKLGSDAALVEYMALDGKVFAFIVTGAGIEVVRDLGSEDEITSLLAGFRFQIDALRFGAANLRKHLPVLTERTRIYLARLYDLLLRKVESKIGARRLVIVPHRALHYVPFHALHDGTGYVIERREVSYAPSARVFSQRRHAEPQGKIKRMLLLGVADGATPRVRDEIRSLATLFPETDVLLDEQATLAALQEKAPQADILHMACHGNFRPDNPLFSSLRLNDGWLTVRDAYQLKLKSQLVCLSACETGVNSIAPGDELIGLARGFFSAGASSLLLSLWTVDDEATAELMVSFYTRLRSGDAPATALRYAQCEMLQRRAHPFFWSPFVLIGG